MTVAVFVPPAVPVIVTSPVAKSVVGLAEDDGEVDRRRVRRIGLARGLVDRDGRRRLVDDDRVAGREVAVARAGAAELVAGVVGDRVVVDQVEPERAVAGTGRDGDRVGRVAGRVDGADRLAADRVADVDELEVGRVTPVTGSLNVTVQLDARGVRRARAVRA